MSAAIVGDRTKGGVPLVAIGGSAGSIEPLLTVVGELPPDLPAAVLVVIHIPRTGTSALPKVIGRATALAAAHARDGEALRSGRIYVAPPDHHLTVADGHALVRRGPTVNRSRPAIDPLFQSAALAAGSRATGVILSGSLDDGAAGLAAIAESGGTTIVQEPDEALYPSMPQAALARAIVHHRIPVRRIGSLIATHLANLDRGPAPAQPQAEHLEKELRMTEMERPDVTTDELDAATPSVYGCPACGGTLWELRDGGDFRFRCRVGHAFSPGTLLEAQNGSVEDGLWIAVRALDEQAGLARRLADQAGVRGDEYVQHRFEAQATTAEKHASAIRELLRLEPGADGEPEHAVEARAG